MLMPIVDLSGVKTELASKQFSFINPVDVTIQVVTGLEAAERIVATQGKNAGRLRASKPPMQEIRITRTRHGFTADYSDHSLVDCAAAQVWRYVAFEASPQGQHHCLPVMAVYDCPFDLPHEQLNAFSKWCQDVADIILKTMKNKPGLMRWAGLL